MQKDQMDWTKLVPPSYLLGSTLILWGALAGHPLLGLGAALMLECHRWVQWRWAFSDQDYIRVWNLCVVLFLIVAVFQIVGQESGRWQVTRVFQQWMPILLFPMIWAQYFSSRPNVPMLTFSFVARHKRLYDERAGRRVEAPRRAHLGYLYFAVLLLSIGALGKGKPSMGEWLSLSSPTGFGGVSTVYLAVALLLAWAISTFIPRRGWLTAAVLLLLASGLGHYTHGGLRLLHGIVENKAMEWINGRGSSDAAQTRTEFGQVGKLKLSRKIFWRAKHIEGKRPTLLPEAGYHEYSNRWWKNQNKHEETVTRVKNQKQWEIDNIAVIDATGVMEIRGRVQSREQLLPRLDDTALVFDLDSPELRKNGLGTLIARPTYSTIKYTLYSGPTGLEKLEQPGNKGNDLVIADFEKTKIKQFADSLGVPTNATTTQRIDAVKHFFADPANNFRYSKYLKGIGVSDLNSKTSHIGWFLQPKGRSGHCEYYATSTVLLLRALDVSSRYVVGYGVQEFDPETKEYVLRGTHRHAWARAWIAEEKKWVNVDTTPGNWWEVESDELSSLQRLLDQWDQWMVAWNLWRRDDNKGLLWTLLPLLLAGGLLIVVVIRLFRGLRESKKSVIHSAAHGREVTLLGIDSAWFRLEESLTEHSFPRPTSQSVRRWARQLISFKPEWGDLLPQIVETHYRYRFDPEGIPETECLRFETAVATLHERLTEIPAEL